MTTKEELQTIATSATKANRPFTAEEVVKEARDKRKFPELHSHLWSPSLEDLAMEARLNRAHRLIVDVRVTLEEGSTSRVYVATNLEKGYRPVESIAGRDDLASAKLKEWHDRLESIRRDIENFRELISPTRLAKIDAALGVVATEFSKPVKPKRSAAKKRGARQSAAYL